MTQQKFLCIPEISSILRLEEDWTFALYREHRNYGLMEILCNEKGDRWGWNNPGYGKAIDFVTLTKGTELRLDRIYVRQGSSAFSSITFVIQKNDDPRFIVPGKGKKAKPGFKKVRFWAKLADVNEAKMLLIKDTAAEEPQAINE